MSDTATSDYYNQMVQTNNDLASGGVTGIQLVKLDFGSVMVNGSTAQATTTETWRTTYADGTVDVGTDQNNYSLVLDNGAWKVSGDDQPGGQIDVPGVGISIPIPAFPGGPPPATQPAPAGQPATSQNSSRNWSGYAATGGKFTSVTGTWTVPQAAAGSLGADAAWVGIGGVTSRDLIQAGTQEITDGSGHVQYQAWVETLPRASQPVALTVSPGDSVTVTLTEQSAGQWAIALKDDTTGATYNTTRQYSSSESSAEWVQEAPSGGRSVVPLDNFGTVQFSAGSAVENGKTVSISGAGAKPITMIDGSGQPLATPSALGSDGASFSVSRTANTGTPSGSQFPTRGRRGGFGRSGLGSGF